tara:strand:- start:2455 stop:2895 length:441 start_codon:yes stop_codon:yes gene_type:complete
MSTTNFVILFILILIFFIEIDFSFNSDTYIENFNLFGFIKPRNDGNWSNNMKKARYKAGNKKRVEEKKKAELSKSQKKIAMDQQGKIDELNNTLTRLETEMKSQQKELSKSKDMNKKNQYNLELNKKELKKSTEEEKKRQKGDSKF